MDLHPFKGYRQEHNLTQNELAIMLDLSYASISRIEAGKQDVTTEIAERAEQKLGIPRLSSLYPNNKNSIHTKNPIFKSIFSSIKNFFLNLKS